MNWPNLLLASGQTLLMTVLSTVLAYLVGLPLGVLLNVTSKKGLHPNRWINLPLGVATNVMRSIPCLILIAILMPLTRAVVGRGSGDWYTMVIPLFFASFAFVSRLVEGSLNEVDEGAVEAVRSMGASDAFLIKNVLFKEAGPHLYNGLALASITILGYTAFAYDLGAGGLIASAYSYYTNHTSDYLGHPDIWVIILLVVVIVQLIQEAGLYVEKKTDKRRSIP
jgi:D-methionine transport system permease protein